MHPVGGLTNEDKLLLFEAEKKRDWKILKTNKQRYLYQRLVALNHPGLEYQSQEICNFTRKQLGKLPIDFIKRKQEVEQNMGHIKKDSDLLKEKLYKTYLKLDLKELEKRAVIAKEWLVANITDEKNYSKGLIKYEALTDAIQTKNNA